MITITSIKHSALYKTIERVDNASINSSGAHPTPRATVGHLLALSAPGVGHSQFYRGLGGWALVYLGATPGHLTRVFERHITYREGRGLCQRLGLVHQELEKLVDVFKGLFSKF